MDSVTFYFDSIEGDASTYNSKGFLNTPKNLLKNEQFVDIPHDILANNIQQTVAKIADVFNTNDSVTNKYDVDEIEFGLNIGTDGKVSIIAAEASASVSTSIRIKLKRKEQ